MVEWRLHSVSMFPLISHVLSLVTANVSGVKTQLSRLLKRVENGEEVVIARNGKPVAKLVQIRQRGKRVFGSMKGLIELDDSFFDPLPEEELRLWEGGD